MKLFGWYEDFTMEKLGLLCAKLSILYCAVLHLCTFAWPIHLPWLLPGIALCGISVACSPQLGSAPRGYVPSGSLATVGYVLLGYSIITFVWWYHLTGGATGVDMLEGRYVSLYKSQILRSISAEEYLWFPALWTRIMSSWLCMMLVFLLNLLRESRTRLPRMLGEH